MNNLHLTFHHFGLAVRRPDEARKLIASFGYQFGVPVFDPAQNVHLQFCMHTSQPAVEIIWPGDTTSPVDKLTSIHPTGIIYHICYETHDLAAALAVLQAASLKPICISPPKPALLFSGRPVSFYNIVGIGLVEILET